MINSYKFVHTFDRRGKSGEYCIAKGGVSFSRDPVMDPIKAALPGLSWHLGHDGDSIHLWTTRVLTGQEFGAVTDLMNSTQAAG